MNRARIVLAGLAVWTLIALYFATQAYFNPAFRLRPHWGEAVAINLTYYYLWGLATPVVIALAKRFPIRRWTSLLVHAVASIVLTTIQLTLAELILRTFTTAVYRQYGLAKSLETAFSVNFHGSLPTYWLILAAYLAWSYARNASRLEAQLSRAQLDALKMQLNPHFLFNTLNSVSSLMYSDVDAADAMLARLSSFLRMTLDHPPAPMIALEDELVFVRRYLDIERVRFEDRLRVTIDVDANCARLAVPSLVLQPLVENAIHHGIARLDDGGEIAIRAHCGDRLHLSVWNAAPATDASETHVGLSNTIARVNAAGGSVTYGPETNGFRVEIVLPCIAS